MNNEVIELRTNNTKTFQLENGSYQLQGYQENIHYQDENGVWQEIDCTIEDNRVCKCEYDISLLQGEIGYTGKDIAGKDITVKLNAPYVEPVVEGNKVIYNISDDLAYEIIFAPQGVATHVVLHNENAPKDFEYELYRSEDSPWTFISEGIDSEGQKAQLKEDQSFLEKPKEYEHTLLKQHWTGQVAYMDPDTRKREWKKDKVSYPVYIS